MKRITIALLLTVLPLVGACEVAVDTSNTPAAGDQIASEQLGLTKAQCRQIACDNAALCGGDFICLGKVCVALVACLNVASDKSVAVDSSVCNDPNLCVATL
jgi:hypothetical protein